jgi:hypothetical protein
VSLQWRRVFVSSDRVKLRATVGNVTGGGKLKCPQEKHVAVTFCPASDFSRIKAEIYVVKPVNNRFFCGLP